MELGQHWNAKLVSHCESRIQARHCESRSDVAIHASTPRPMDRFVPRDDGAGVLRPRPGHCKSLTQLRHCESRTQPPSLRVAHPTPVIASRAPNSVIASRALKLVIASRAATWQSMPTRQGPWIASYLAMTVLGCSGRAQVIASRGPNRHHCQSRTQSRHCQSRTQPPSLQGLPRCWHFSQRQQRSGHRSD